MFWSLKVYTLSLLKIEIRQLFAIIKDEGETNNNLNNHNNYSFFTVKIPLYSVLMTNTSTYDWQIWQISAI